jgi:hypothetical protein
VARPSMRELPTTITPNAFMNLDMIPSFLFQVTVTNDM